MRPIEMSAIDLNLLVALDVLLQERNVTRAAKRLHLTQSATSHALARLREQLGDPLLVRVGRGMRATPKAERLADEVPRLLRTIRRVLGSEGAFDAATSERVFTLGGPDFIAAIMPSILKRMIHDAPRAGLELVLTDAGVVRELVDGRFDLAIAAGRAVEDEGVRTYPLGVFPWVVFARKGHPAVRGWSAEAWARWPHIRVRRGTGAEGPVDAAAREGRLQRRATVFLPQFTLAAQLLAETDLLLTVPSGMLCSLAERHGLVALEAPIALPPFRPFLYVSAELAHDPAVGFVRELVRQAFAEIVKAAGEMAVVPLAERARGASAGRPRGRGLAASTSRAG